ncbi:hypothetical protein K435DRAFT_814023, partial [Dendrothele bispora CBS 962.96]
MSQNEPTRVFDGDFFGQDYQSEDFPGFGDRNGPITIHPVDGDSEGEKNEQSEDEEDDTGVAALEKTWEPPRALAAAPEPTAQDMEIDEDYISARNNSLLGSLPAHREGIYVEKFGGQAGAPISEYNPPAVLQGSDNGFSYYQSQIQGSEENKWAPFSSRMDWEIARWAKMRGTGSTAFSDLLDIDGVYEAFGISYKNSTELNEIIDHEIPSQRPSFHCTEVVIAGEAFDLYKRDILECIRALYKSPEHARYLCVAPERHYSDADKTSRLYHDLYTGKWWWSTQKALEEDKPGATIVPVILSSDKTQVTLFRNKSAYPVYLTIGNLPKEIRRKPSQQGQILLAYLPTTKLEHISNKAARRRTVANLFHACMGSLVAPLKRAGIEGVVLQSGEGVKRRCHPILAAYIGDYPEQMLVTCGYYGDSPNIETLFNALMPLKKLGTDEWVKSCQDVDIKPVQHPFWEDLPYTDIFRSITPDILHQLYQGVMKHLIEWLTKIVGANEMDARVRRLPANHGIRHFHKGITTLSR